MRKLNKEFLMLNKPYFDKGLKRLDILILAQIQECNKNNSQCCFTNQQLSELFGKDESTIKRTLRRLDDMNAIKRQIISVKGNGKATRQRVLFVNDVKEWKI